MLEGRNGGPSAKLRQLSWWSGKWSVKWAAAAATWWIDGVAASVSATTPAAFSAKNLVTAGLARCAGGMRNSRRFGPLQLTRHGLDGGDWPRGSVGWVGEEVYDKLIS